MFASCLLQGAAVAVTCPPWAACAWRWSAEAAATNWEKMPVGSCVKVVGACGVKVVVFVLCLSCGVGVLFCVVVLCCFCVVVC
jgi:hypothetical protein